MDGPRVLRIETTDAERDVVGVREAYEFEVAPDGAVTITEHWGRDMEVYSDVYSIAPPARVWDIALPWIIARRPSSPTVGDR